MAVRGIGVDIVHISRIEQALSRWGDRFRRKIFTEKELLLARNRSRQGRFFALRFAAKEAFAKALGSGIRYPVRWRDVEIDSDHQGKPEIVLHGELKKWCKEHNIYRYHLSLSDDGDHAIAFVIIEGDEICT